MRRFGGLLILAFLTAACDTGPDGPGDLSGSIRAPQSSLGGVVFEMVGQGIEDFSGEEGTKVYWARQDDPIVYRVIVIGETGGDLQFRVSVADRGNRLPRALVVSAVDLENRPVPVTSDFEVKLRR